MKTKDSLDSLVQNGKAYIEAKGDELKLKTTYALSKALGKTVSMFLIIGVFLIVLALLAYALLQVLNKVLSAPWGTLVAAGVFVVLLVVLYIFRGKMFRDSFVKLFINVFYSKEEEGND